MSPSTLTWLAHDPAEQERTRRVIKLFDERGTVDELGIGGIRDSIADQLFPGTSTIQTRLRYFLFLPWLYRDLEERERPSEKFRSEARALQYRLSRALLEGGETLGVIGSALGPLLKTTPDAIYWNGLRIWGIRRFEGTIGQYVDALPSIYRLRGKQPSMEGGEPLIDSRAFTWHPELPHAPDGWLEEATFRLSIDEAQFLQDRILETHSASLLALLAGDPVPTDFGVPWEHAAYAGFPDNIQQLLHHAHLFSDVIYGAALLYNLMLARKQRHEERIDQHAAAFAIWADEIETPRIRGWDMNDFWFHVSGHGYRITQGTRDFVHRWVDSVAADKRSLDASPAHALIEARERRLKGFHARLQNNRALDLWGGASGLNRLTYRWEEAQRYLGELAEGLSAA